MAFSARAANHAVKKFNKKNKKQENG